jgi:hypothetical protein
MKKNETSVRRAEEMREILCSRSPNEVHQSPGPFCLLSLALRLREDVGAYEMTQSKTDMMRSWRGIRGVFRNKLRLDRVILILILQLS